MAKIEQKIGNLSKRAGIKLHILVITTLPLLFACALITFFASWILKDGLAEQVLTGLRSSATGALISLDSISSESFRMEGDDLYKGNFNVTQNMAALDYYAQSNEVELTFFYGDTIRATTIKDSAGARENGIKADSDIVTKVLRGGNDYSSNDVHVNGKHFYGYYMPVSDTDGNVIGMVFAAKSKAYVTRYITTRILFIVGIAILNYVSSMFLAIKVSNKRFLYPIRKLLGVAKELARGNVNQTIARESNDEFGDLTDSFIEVMDNVKSQANVATKMAEGDLTVTYKPVDDVDVMGHAIDKMIHDNNASLSLINDASDSIVNGVKEIASASNSLAEGAEQQASAVEEITASIEGIADSAKINAEDAKHANELALKTSGEAVRGNERMQEMMAAMEDISTSSKNISGIMKAIDDISFQTNIISLNASVEAARAGEHGKGFAVVAEEIRNLAAKSAAAAKNSESLIEDSIKKTERGAELAEESAKALQDIMDSVEEMTTLIGNIAKASSEQSASVSEVKTGIMQISDVVQTNSATSEECAAEAAQLSQLSEQLKRAVQRYRLAGR